MMKRNYHATITLPKRHLRPLVFWAAVGVNKSIFGSYGEVIEDIIDAYQRELKMGLSCKPRFRKALKGK